MAENDNLSGAFVSGYDQLSAHVESLANMVATYNKALRADGLPEELVNVLTVQFADALWEKVLYKEHEGSE